LATERTDFSDIPSLWIAVGLILVSPPEAGPSANSCQLREAGGCRWTAKTPSMTRIASAEPSRIHAFRSTQ